MLQNLCRLIPYLPYHDKKKHLGANEGMWMRQHIKKYITLIQKYVLLARGVNIKQKYCGRGGGQGGCKIAFFGENNVKLGRRGKKSHKKTS